MICMCVQGTVTFRWRGRSKSVCCRKYSHFSVSTLHVLRHGNEIRLLLGEFSFSVSNTAMTNGGIKLLKIILPGLGSYKSRKRKQSRYKHKIQRYLEFCSFIFVVVTGHEKPFACLCHFVYQYQYLYFSVCPSSYILVPISVCLPAF
jgi:hypothetical protein